MLRYYDVNKAVKIQCDSSKDGIGAVLLQDDQPVAFASRAMIDSETRYAQIEKELLAIVFAFEKFHQYVYAKETVVESDHKPLVTIVKKPLDCATPRIQRMLMRLQRYTYEVVYKPGKEMYLADCLSRAYDKNNKPSRELVEDIAAHVHLVLEQTPMSEEKIEKVKKETLKDEELGQLIRTIHNGWPDESRNLPGTIRKYWNYREDLTEIDGIIYKGTKIFIPQTMKEEILQILHDSHLGREKTKSRARDVLFWHNMNKDIEDHVAKCKSCLKFRKSEQKEPLIPTEVPVKRWNMLNMDMCFWEDKNILVITDYMTRWIEVAEVPDLRCETITKHVKAICARHGIPSVIRSDNGTHFTGKEFGKFCKEWGINHKTSSPYHHQSNGLAEKSVQIIKNILKKAKDSGTDFLLGLLEYRNTPLESGIGSPAQLLYSRRMKTKLPITDQQLKPEIIPDQVIKEQLQKTKAKQKFYYDKTAKPKSDFKVGEKVLIQETDKRRPIWKPGTVLKQEDTPRSYRVKLDNGSELRRNSKVMIRNTNPNPTNKNTELDDNIDEEIIVHDIIPQNQNEDNNAVPEDNQTIIQPEVVKENSVTRTGRSIRNPVWMKDYVHQVKGKLHKD